MRRALAQIPYAHALLRYTRSRRQADELWYRAPCRSSRIVNRWGHFRSRRSHIVKTFAKLTRLGTLRDTEVTYLGLKLFAILSPFWRRRSLTTSRYTEHKSSIHHARRPETHVWKATGLVVAGPPGSLPQSPANDALKLLVRSAVRRRIHLSNRGVLGDAKINTRCKHQAITRKQF